MKEAIVAPGPNVEIKDSPIPQPGPDEVLIKIIVSGSNPKDWKVPEWMNKTHNSGDDMAGYVEQVGSNVTEFHKGDRVAAFHVMRSENGSFAEFGISPEHTVFHLPAKTSFEEAATIPLAAMTAAVGLFIRLGLPQPWTGGREDGDIKDPAKAYKTGPLLVYGAASAVGAFAIRLAKRANIGPIIGVAGRGIPFVKSLLDESKGDTIVDYRQDSDAVVSNIQAAIPPGQELKFCFDAVSEKGSYVNASKVLAKDGKITLVLPNKEYSEIPDTIKMSKTQVGDVHGRQKDFGHAWFRLFARGLQQGWFRGHPHTVISGGLSGVEEALKLLKDGKASATKYVFRIGDTPGVNL